MITDLKTENFNDIMGTAFYILMGILGVLCLINFFSAKAQKKSKVRTFGMWVNGVPLLMILLAIIIAVFLK